MAEEIISGIFRIPLPLPGLSLGGVHVYLLKTYNGWILVDTGMGHPRAVEELNRQLDEIGVKKKDIHLILLTHNHPDHSGMAGKLQKETKAHVAIHEKDWRGNEHHSANSIDKTLTRNGLSIEHISQLTNMGEQMMADFEPFHPDWLLNGNEYISAGDYSFQILQTPGHTPGHICLYDQEREILLAGDHILPGVSPNIGYGPDDPLANYFTSLQDIQKIPVRLALPAHGEPINDTKQRIREIIIHHEKRINQIRYVLGSSKKTAFDITSKLEWKGGSVTWCDMKDDEQSMALLETLAHLQYMENRKYVTRVESSDIDYYQAT